MPKAAPAAPRKPAAKQVVPAKKTVTRKTAAPKPAATKRAAIKPAVQAAVKTTARTKKRSTNKLFVLDTNILLHDPNSLLRFEEHDIYIPFVTIEELDAKKAGTQDINRNARAATRLITQIIAQPGYTLQSGYPLESFNGGHAKGRLYLQDRQIDFLAGESVKKNDNLYLAVLEHLSKTDLHSSVVMVSLDLNMRIKAVSQGFIAEDYKHDHVIEDTDLIAKGLRNVEPEEYATWEATMTAHAQGERTIYEVPGDNLVANEFLVLPSDDRLYCVSTIEEIRGEKRATLTSVRNYTTERNAVMGISARDAEQAAALELLTNPDVHFVALLGKAGSGKTLLALAASMMLTVEESLYDNVMCTRAMVPVGEEIGFLPGSEEEKIAPWLEAMTDNLEVIIEANAESAVDQQKLREQFKERVSFRAMTFMRGRTFHNKFVIIDEAQNLTPKQMKTLITRSGQNTKVVCLGNFEQIDTPYLSETSNGLTYATERFRGWPHFGALVLERCHRSLLADEANKRL